MLIVILGFVIGVIIAIKTFNSLFTGDPNAKMYCIMIDILTGGLGSVIGLLLLLLFFVTFSPVIPSKEVVKEYTLCEVNSVLEQKVENNSKYITYSPSPGYTYAIKTKDGIKVNIVDLSGDNVKVNIGDYSPKVKVKTKALKYKSWEWLFFLGVPSNEQYEFYIPKEDNNQ